MDQLGLAKSRRVSPLEAEARGVGYRTCTACGKPKPLSAFYFLPGNGKKPRSPRHSSHCRACVRIANGARRETDEYRAWLTAYLAREDVQERRRESDRKRRDKHRATRRKYRSTPRAKLLHCRRQARVELKQTTSESRRRRLEALIDAYTIEIDRIMRAMNVQPKSSG